MIQCSSSWRIISLKQSSFANNLHQTKREHRMTYCFLCRCHLIATRSQSHKPPGYAQLLSAVLFQMHLLLVFRNHLLAVGSSFILVVLEEEGSFLEERACHGCCLWKQHICLLGKRACLLSNLLKVSNVASSALSISQRHSGLQAGQNSCCSLLPLKSFSFALAIRSLCLQTLH